MDYERIDICDSGNDLADLTLSSNGDYIASSYYNDKNVLLHDSNGKRVRIYKNEQVQESLAFSGDQTFLAMGGYRTGHSSTITVHCVEKGELLATEDCHSGVEALGWSKSGNLLASAHRDLCLRIWEPTNLKLIHKIDIEPPSSDARLQSGIRFIEFIDDEKILLGGYSHGLSARTINKEKLWAHPKARLLSMKIAEGTGVVLANTDGKLSFFNLSDGKLVKCMQKLNANAESFADQSLDYFVAKRDKEIRIVNKETKEILASITNANYAKSSKNGTIVVNDKDNPSGFSILKLKS